tara:strand:- start:2347 stop:3159 length:813 start_codon:yes stop_codon:yes gene_type:complete
MGLPARAFYLLMRIAPPRIRSRMWNRLYQRMAKSQTDPTFRFMNYGYIDDFEVNLDEEDEKDRLFIQLYEMNVRDVSLKDKHVLEVGSGRGGGASWIAKTFSPERLVAVDYSGEAVKLCSNWYSSQENLEFITGNAEMLPLPDESFHIVYNVESSHCYGDIPKFLSEAFRVLIPGGNLCWTDMRDQSTMENMEAQFTEAGFVVETSRDVTGNVIDALNLIEEDRKMMIRKSAPRSLRKSFETFGGVPGTPIYEALKSGRIKYFRYLLSKE